MITKMETKRIFIFIAFAFGIAWTAGLIVAYTGGIVNSPVLLPGTGVTLALLLIATVYMWSPAIASILTRLITREGWDNALLRPNLKRNRKFYLAAWLLPAFITILGTLLFFLLQPRYFDPELGVIRSMLDSQGVDLPMPSLTILLAQLIQGILLAPLVNSLFTFGEELGWRGYLLPKLMPISGRKAVIISGIIWGIWHAPVIAMGHNYGFEYPLFPWADILAMTWFTIMAGMFLAWVTLRAGSVWPAVIGHAAINGTAGIGALAVAGNPSTLIGPLPMGLVGGVGWFICAAIIFFSSKALASFDTSPTISPPVDTMETILPNSTEKK